MEKMMVFWISAVVMETDRNGELRILLLVWGKRKGKGRFVIFSLLIDLVMPFIEKRKFEKADFRF